MTVVDFYDDTGKQRTGELKRQIKRGRRKGWYKVECSVHGKPKIFTVDEVEEKTLTMDNKKLNS